MSFHNKYPVPEEMKAFPNWVVWGKKNNRQNKFPYSPITGQLSSSIDPNTWAPYEVACAYAEANNFAGIGFTLSIHDPFAVIDLDDPKGDPNIIVAQEAIFKNFNSYAEISPSQRGLHIIIKGVTPKGRKRNKVEIYSSCRYITMTGNAYRNSPIVSCQEELSKLYMALGGTEKEAYVLDGFAEETISDEELWEIAANAANGDKFVDLWEGRWEEHYPLSEGPSEADFALIDIIAHYTDSKTQITRMFLDSELGKRPKAHRRDYLTWMLDKCFDNKLPPVDLMFMQTEIAEQISKFNIELENEKEEKPEEDTTYYFPPGLIGEIANFIYAQSFLPLKETALTGALALMSGIVGRAYNVSGTGLNLYYLLLAETGRGKEAMAKGMDSLFGAVCDVMPTIQDFRGPGEISSPQALIRHMDAGHTSFVSTVGEFGLFFKQMTMPNAPTNLVGLRRLLLDLYNKSGKGQMIKPTITADKAKNTKAILSPAISVLGESTPIKFYEALSEDMIAEGWLPRWLIIEYRGDRSEPNWHHSTVKPPQGLVDKIASLCCNVATINSQNNVIDIGFTAEGNKAQLAYYYFCHNQINSSTASVRTELWNRAHFKVLKLSALVAVGINPYDPIICENCVNWAIRIVNKDCKNIIKRFEIGDVGGDADESQQIVKMTEYITEFVSKPFNSFTKTIRSLSKIGLYHSEKIVPYSYLHKRAVQVKTFKEDKLGATGAIKKTIKSLIETDDIALLPAAERKRLFDSTSPCYIIKNFGLFTDATRKGI